MTGSVALDVVIGLVFIYLLYSLFATVLMEMLSASLDLRARNLRYTIRRMLMDEKENLMNDIKIKTDDHEIIKTLKYIIGFIMPLLNFFLKLFFKIYNSVIKISGRSGNLKNPESFHKFFNQPTIKYLGGGGISNKPSYITSQNFSKALSDVLKSNFNSESLLEKIIADFDRLDESSEIMKAFNNSLNGDKSNIKNFKKWLKEEGDSHKLKIVWDHLKTNSDSIIHLGLIPEQAKYNRTTLKHLLELGLEANSPLEKIKAGITILPEGSDTKKHIESLLKDANNDLQKFKLLLEQWFDDTMERSSGWFKRRVQYLLFIIGFFLAVSFNANTLDIIKKLSNDPEARGQLVDLAIAYSEENKKPRNNGNSNNNNPIENGDKVNDSLKDIENAKIAKANDSLLNAAKLIRSDIYEAQNIISSNWQIPDSIEVHAAKDIPEDYVKHTYKLVVWDSIRGSNGKLKITKANKMVTSIIHKSIYWKSFENSIPPASRATFDKGKINVDQNKYKWCYVFANNGWNFKHLWGYILTALAISLGSTFWFDLLNKLIKLRSSVKPSEQKGNGDTTNSDNSNSGDASLINRVG